jgi:hypothetical protein
MSQNIAGQVDEDRGEGEEVLVTIQGKNLQ